MTWGTASSTCYALHGHHPPGPVILTQQDTHLRAGANFQSPQIGLNHWWRIISVSNKLPGQPTSLSSLTYCDSSNLQFHCIAHSPRGTTVNLALVSENRSSFVWLGRPYLWRMSQGSSLAAFSSRCWAPREGRDWIHHETNVPARCAPASTAAPSTGQTQARAHTLWKVCEVHIEPSAPTPLLYKCAPIWPYYFIV